MHRRPCSCLVRTCDQWSPSVVRTPLLVRGVGALGVGGMAADRLAAVDAAALAPARRDRSISSRIRQQRRMRCKGTNRTRQRPAGARKRARSPRQLLRACLASGTGDRDRELRTDSILRG
jgi:hypothetical protein